MQVELHPPAALGRASEHLSPELVTSLGYAALAMHAECEPGNARAGLQQAAHGVTAVGCVVLRRQPLNPVRGVGAVDPRIPMRPQTQLEVQTARRCLVTDE